MDSTITAEAPSVALERPMRTGRKRRIHVTFENLDNYKVPWSAVVCTRCAWDGNMRDLTPVDPDNINCKSVGCPECHAGVVSWHDYRDRNLDRPRALSKLERRVRERSGYLAFEIGSWED